MWYTWYVENNFRRISGISGIYLPHANLFNLFNLLFIKYTCDTRDTWRMVSGVSQGSRGYICLTQICSIYLICCLYKIYMWYKWYVENGFQREIKIFFCEQSSPCDQQIHTTPLTQKNSNSSTEIHLASTYLRVCYIFLQNICNHSIFIITFATD